MQDDRRRFLGLLLGGAATSALAAAPTPRQTAGPFYPRSLPLDADNDLVSVSGRGGLADGAHCNVFGQVLDTAGKPLADTRVEIWQCDARGKYHHPDDPNPVIPDENFQGFGSTVTDADGRYRFRTIKPVPYPGRTPHIHFRVVTPAGELTTQLYVRGHEGNARDGLFRRLGDRQERVLADFVAASDDSAKLEARFDIVFG